MVDMVRSPLRGSAAAVAAISMAAVVAGCQAVGALAFPQPVATTVTPLPQGQHIGAATWTDGPWPFTVTQGDLRCSNEGPVQVQTFTADGITYSLNPAAKDTDRYPPVDVIWRQDPALPGFKIDISEVIDYARQLCPGQR